MCDLVNVNFVRFNRTPIRSEPARQRYNENESLSHRQTFSSASHRFALWQLISSWPKCTVLSLGPVPYMVPTQPKTSDEMVLNKNCLQQKKSWNFVASAHTDSNGWGEDGESVSIFESPAVGESHKHENNLSEPNESHYFNLKSDEDRVDCLLSLGTFRDSPFRTFLLSN